MAAKLKSKQTRISKSKNKEMTIFFRLTKIIEHNILIPMRTQIYSNNETETDIHRGFIVDFEVALLHLH